jgi:hypothetical protein
MERVRIGGHMLSPALACRVESSECSRASEATEIVKPIDRDRLSPAPTSDQELPAIKTTKGLRCNGT